MRTPAALVVAVALVAGTAACNGDSGTPTVSGSGPAVDIMTEARETVAMLYKETFNPPDTGTRIAAKGRKLAILSLGQASPSTALPVNAAAEAGQQLGWTVHILDVQFDPRRASGLIREAISLGVHAIITTIDCGYAADAFAEAKGKGILIAPLAAFDCTDPTAAGAAGTAQFTTFVNYGVSQLDNARFMASTGALAASVLIAATKGTAKVLAFTDPAVTVLTYTHAGFLAQMARCSGCTVLESVNLASTEPPAALQAKVSDALARHPDANAIRSSHSSATQLYIAPALVASGRQSEVLVIGGEGSARDLDLIRTRQGLNLTVSADTVWFGWAIVDAVNSAFNGEAPRPAGMGVMLVDKDHNLPPSGPVQHNINFKGIYRKAWGVG